MFASWFSLFQADPRDLLPRATEYKKAGDLNRAIATLRKAYAGIAAGGISYPVETFLRLPMYLQAAGRRDEAWAEFMRLLEEGYPNQPPHDASRWMDRATIYDKMRLFLQREGRMLEAVKYAVLSYLASIRGNALQTTPVFLPEYSDVATVPARVEEWLRKTDRPDLAPQLVEVVSAELRHPEAVDVEQVASRLDQVLNLT